MLNKVILFSLAAKYTDATGTPFGMFKNIRADGPTVKAITGIAILTMKTMIIRSQKQGRDQPRREGYGFIHDADVK
ncbi:hypothetical protein INT43_004615 [Umbelopsis isabellina]|uniref:Uncharacterized protein n=1 Tax=Mortierella isabellina TaxID=91625 RepID=A0A8H7U760_MORIS|nr:hypothetical protein INT43_004615 [Umbelopsis isabellina]